jgi:hypothetical protein
MYGASGAHRIVEFELNDAVRADLAGERCIIRLGDAA